MDQYNGDEAELLDEQIDHVQILSGYYQPTLAPQIEDGWDWNQNEEEDDWRYHLDFGPVGPNAPLAFNDTLEWPDDDDQSILDEYQLVSVVTTQYFGEDAERLDSDDDEQVITEYSIGDPDALQSQLTFDWFSQEDDDYVIDDYQLIDVVVTTTQYFGEDSELFDETLDLVQLSNSYQQSDWSQAIEDPWDYTDDDDSIILDEYQNVTPSSIVEDAFDWSTDDDDQAPLDEYRQSPVTNYYGDEAEQLDESIDEWSIDEYQQSIFVSLSLFENDWEYAEDDEQAALDEYQNLPPPIITLIYGMSITAIVAYGLVAQIRVRRSIPPWRLNASQAWLGYRTGNGGGIY